MVLDRDRIDPGRWRRAALEVPSPYNRDTVTEEG
jgi:hypothetical protein